MQIQDIAKRWGLTCPNCGTTEENMTFKPNGEVLCEKCNTRVKKR